MSTTGLVLLAEDNPDDVLLVRLGFKKAKCDSPIIVVKDGEEVIAYLKGEGQYGNRSKFPIPAVLLLDLKLPRVTGFEVLKWIRNRQEWKCLPVIVLTTSHYGKDIEDSYDLGANSFLTKPTDINEWMSAIEQTLRFWLSSSSLPEPGPFVPAPKESKESSTLAPPGWTPGTGRRRPKAARTPQPTQKKKRGSSSCI